MYERFELGGDKLTDQEIISILEKENEYLRGKDVVFQEVVYTTDPPEDIVLITAITNAINYLKDYKNMEVQVEKLEEAVKEINRDRVRLKKERDYYINHTRSKPIGSVKIQYEDGSFETIYKAYESNYTGIQEGE